MVVEATDETGLNSQFTTETVVGRDGHTSVALPIDRVAGILRF